MLPCCHVANVVLREETHCQSLESDDSALTLVWEEGGVIGSVSPHGLQAE